MKNKTKGYAVIAFAILVWIIAVGYLRFPWVKAAELGIWMCGGLTIVFLLFAGLHLVNKKDD